MILGMGVDIIEIERIRRAMLNPRFAARVFTAAELGRIAKRGPQTATGMFAAKEAVSKALGTGFRGFSFADIEILVDSVGKPQARLHGGAAERMEHMGGHRLHVSISHNRDSAVATAIVERIVKGD